MAGDAAAQEDAPLVGKEAAEEATADEPPAAESEPGEDQKSSIEDVIEDKDAALIPGASQVGSVLGFTGASVESLLLQSAARSGDLPKARAALEQGALPNIQDAWGLPPLHSAALGGHTDLVQLLLTNRAEVNLLSAREQTALHLAATECHDGAVAALVDARADVALTTAYGNTALDLAMRRDPGGAAEMSIRREFEQRWRVAKAEVEEQKRRLRKAEDALAVMTRQLGEVPELVGDEEEPQEEGEDDVEVQSSQPKASQATDEDPASAGTSRPASAGAGGRPRPGSASADKAPKPKRGGYWRLAGLTLAELEKGCEAVAARAWFRELPLGDIFPHKGPHMPQGSLLAEIDSDDPELLAGYERLQAAAEMERLRQERWASKRARRIAAGAAVEAQDSDREDVGRLAREKAVLEGTGHSQEEWEKLVKKLSRRDVKWDFSRVEILEKRRDDNSGKTPGVYAIGKLSRRNLKPVFEKGEIIGPLGGTLRRRSRFEELYYEGRTWVLHDPQAYELRLRAKTTELSIEPLVLDLTTGSSQNRLRHLADARNDPMGLRELLSLPGVRPTTAETLRKPRTAMRRPRSRPASPGGEDQGLGDQAPPLSPINTLQDFSAAGIKLTDVPGDSLPSGRKHARVQGESGEPSPGSSPMAQKSPLSAGTGFSLSPSASFHQAESSKNRGVQPGEDESEEAALLANVLHAEVLVDGWPYVFLVAKRDILPGEELMADLGNEHWQTSRFVLQRLKDVNQQGRDILLGTKSAEDMKIAPDEPPPVSFPQRRPMRKVGEELLDDEV